MNDADYATALRGELVQLTKCLEEARQEKEKGRLLLEHLQAERTSLQQQKQQRRARQEQLLQLNLLQKQVQVKKREKAAALRKLADAQRELQELQLMNSVGHLSAYPFPGRSRTKQGSAGPGPSTSAPSSSRRSRGVEKGKESVDTTTSSLADPNDQNSRRHCPEDVVQASSLSSLLSSRGVVQASAPPPSSTTEHSLGDDTIDEMVELNIIHHHHHHEHFYQQEPLRHLAPA